MADIQLSVTSLSVELGRKVDDGARMSRLQHPTGCTNFWDEEEGPPFTFGASLLLLSAF